MIGMPVRQCPRCELRFTSRSELEYHLANDHQPPRAAIPPTTVAVVEAPSEDPSPQPTQTSMSAASAPHGTRRWSHPIGWLFLVVGLVVIALLAWLASTPAALIAAAAVVALTAAYLWRARTRARLRVPDG
jgi:Flp pilus assembly protein TadB